MSFHDCLRTVVRCADDVTAVAVLDTALTSGRVSPYGLDRIFAGEPQSSRRLAQQARPGSESGVESILRQLLESRGHRVEQQLQVSGVGRVDMRIDGMLLVEVDGFAFHRDRVRSSVIARAIPRSRCGGCGGSACPLGRCWTIPWPPWMRSSGCWAC
ncbi:hypothetical protein A0130_15355 [Leifsonia xyli]|nr:hypothetical protein A0130_15355 [Leifsonia xyli]